MQKHLIACVLATLPLASLQVAKPATRPAADTPRLIELQKKDDIAVIFRDGEVTTIVVTCPSGIGGMKLERVGKTWGKKIVVRLEYEGGRGFGNLESADVTLLGDKPREDLRLIVQCDPRRGKMEVELDDRATKFDRMEITWIDAFRR